ncbi:MAG: hypothetical protein ACKESB_00290 [Candidatus Hodgkinia cicadicola]
MKRARKERVKDGERRGGRERRRGEWREWRRRRGRCARGRVGG